MVKALRLCVASLLLVAGASACASKPLPTTGPKPNILFILTDDHRWDALGCYGNKDVATPSFDRIAKEGVVLDAFYVAIPLCCPSRATFLSGRYPRQTGVLCKGGGLDFPRPTPTVASYLDKLGYVTGFVGKTHMGGDPHPWGFQEAPVWQDVSDYGRPTLIFDGVPRPVSGSYSKIFVDGAIAFVEKHKAERWFLWLATTAPHAPLVHDPAFPYDPAAISPPPGLPPGTPMSAFDWAGYYSNVSSLDQEVGRLLDRLDALGLARDTFVLVAGDNGLMCGSHGGQYKDLWYEESTRTPGLARWGGHIPKATRLASPVTSVDLLPTLLDLAGSPLPRGFDGLEGASMVPALLGQAPLRSIAFSEGRLSFSKEFPGDPWFMARERRYKLVKIQSGDEHLYDLEKDPHETVDLMKSSPPKSVVVALEKAMQSWGEPSRKP